MILVMLLITGLLILLLAGLAPPSSGRPAVGHGQRRIGRSGSVPGDDIIGAAAEQDSWTELDEYQLRRLLDS